MSSDSTELYYAHMEADRNEAVDAYFKARPGFGELERSIFRAGFERAYAKLWPLTGAPTTAQETPAARRCRCGQVEWEDGARRISCGDGSDHYVDYDCVSASNRGESR